MMELEQLVTIWSCLVLLRVCVCL